jgi:DNA-binding transcriptional regulator YiaG
MLPLAMTPEQLKARRARLGLTQTALAEKIGVTWSTVARWETDQRPIPAIAVRLLDCMARESRRTTRRQKGKR